MPDPKTLPTAAESLLAGILDDRPFADLSPAERIAIAQVHATLAVADRIDALDSAVRDLHETLHSRGGAR